MNNLTVIISIILGSIFLLTLQVILISIYKSIFQNSKDEYMISLSTLERVIDDYVSTILSKKIQQTKRKYNLDPESKINSVLAFEKKCNGLISEASLDILKMLTSRTSQTLNKRFSDKSLALFVINRVKHTLEI